MNFELTNKWLQLWPTRSKNNTRIIKPDFEITIFHQYTNSLRCPKYYFRSLWLNDVHYFSGIRVLFPEFNRKIEIIIMINIVPVKFSWFVRNCISFANVWCIWNNLRRSGQVLYLSYKKISAVRQYLRNLTFKPLEDTRKTSSTISMMPFFLINSTTTSPDSKMLI